MSWTTRDWGIERDPDRDPEVSRGRHSREQSVCPIGTLARKGRNGQGSQGRARLVKALTVPTQVGWVNGNASKDQRLMSRKRQNDHPWSELIKYRHCLPTNRQSFNGCSVKISSF